MPAAARWLTPSFALVPVAILVAGDRGALPGGDKIGHALRCGGLACVATLAPRRRWARAASGAKAM